MSVWMKNTIGAALAVVLLAVAFRVLQGDGGEVKVFEFGVKVNPRLQRSSTTTADTAAAPNAAAMKPAECRVPENGIESWGKTEKWTADSDWRRGGSSPGEFCAAQKSAREAQYPEREIVLLGTDEKHRSVRTPFKHDYYRYTCLFEDRWEPIYKLSANARCPAG